MRATNDWFHRRGGAFDDALIATERLLAAGIKPRWQLFLTTKLLPELDDLLGLIRRIRLPERVGELGGQFQLFIHPPGPDHEARKIEGLRPTLNQIVDLPASILESTRKHFAREDLWHTEAHLHAEILAGGDTRDDQNIFPEVLWFFICSKWDVFANIGTLEPWWCLGNLKQDSVASIIARFENEENLGLQTLFHRSPQELALRYGNPRGQKVYSIKEDLLSLYRGEHCEGEWKR
jgi:hypothetical protein